MKRMALISVVVASLFAARLPAVGAEEGSLIHGSGGTSSCGSWTQGRAVAGKGDSIELSTQAGAERLMRESWVFGYLSALNFWYLPTDKGVIRDLNESTDDGGVMAYIDNYCAAHPLDGVFLATKALAVELAGKWFVAHPSRK